MTSELTGSCLCGDVRFRANGDVKRVSACYCSQCQRQNGGGAFYGVELRGQLSVDGEKSLVWYASSKKAVRGFCARCGTSLFWRENDDPSNFDVSLGALSDNVEFELTAHIFVDSCPSYLTIEKTAPHLTEADVLANSRNEDQ